MSNSNRECFIVADLGTTNLKVALADTRGQLLFHSKVTYDFYKPKPLWYEFNANNCFNKFLTLLKEAVKYAKNNNLNIKAICLTGQRESLIFLDKNGNPLTNCISWMDRRSVEVLGEILSRISKNEMYRRTGLIVEPTFPLTKILWFKKHKKEMYEKCWKILQIVEFFNYKLTGKTITDYSLASRSLMFNIVKRSWDEEILETFSIDIDKLPEITPSATIIDYLNEKIARKIGLEEKVPVVNGGGDRPCEALGAGVIENMLGESTGTATNVMYTTREPLFDKKQRILLCGHVIKDSWLMEAGTSPTGGMLEWLCNTLNISIEDFFAKLTKETIMKPCNAIVLPYFMGARAPYWNTNFKGVIYGLSLSTDIEELAKAFILSIIILIKIIIEAYEEIGVTTNVLISYGGLTRSSIFNLLKASILKKEIWIPKVKYPTLVGATILATLAMNEYRDYNEALKNMIEIGEKYKPDEKLSQLYSDYIERFNKLNNEMIKLFSLI